MPIVNSLYVYVRVRVCVCLRFGLLFVPVLGFSDAVESLPVQNLLKFLLLSGEDSVFCKHLIYIFSEHLFVDIYGGFVYT